MAQSLLPQNINPFNPGRAAPSNRLGVAAISEQLFERVTKYHAQIGADVEVSTLQALERKLLEEARVCCYEKRWEEALNTFTHCLAITEKARSHDASTETRSAIVHNIGYCLHCLGEFEAAKAYYEQALEAFKRTRTPLVERWTIGWIFGDINHNRVQFIKERLLDISFGRKPDEEYLDEYGRKRPMPHRQPDGGGAADALSSGWAAGEAPPEPEQHGPSWMRSRYAAASTSDDAEGGVELGAVRSGARSSGAELGGEAAAEGAAAVESAGAASGDDAAQERARREWLQYFLQTADWAKAEELVVTAEEKEDLAYLRQREERTRRDSGEDDGQRL